MADEKIGSIFDVPAYKKYQNRWNTRLKELLYRASYYDGSAYKKYKDVFWQLGPRLYKEVKPIFLPLSRAVDIDAGIIGGDWEFPSIEVEPKSEIWDAARDRLFDMSSWDVEGVLYSHYGAMYGLSGIRVVSSDDGDKKIMVQPARPTCFMLFYEGQYSDKPSLGLWIERKFDEDGVEFEYAEAITEETISTYKNGVPYSFDEQEAEYPNDQKEIPLIEVKHINDGTDLAECTYQKSIHLLNELNEMATDLSQAIHDNVHPQTIVTGAEPGELTKSRNIAWFLPDPNSDAKFLTPTIDVTGVMEFIREIKEGVKESLPELSFDELKKAGQIATATLELQLMELVIKIERVRPNYDRGLVSAMKMAGRLAGILGISELTPLDDEELILDPNRPVLPQMPQEKISLRMQEIELEQMEAGRNNQEGKIA